MLPPSMQLYTTINSCQGWTLDRAVVDVISSPFDHMGMYVGVQFNRVGLREAIGVWCSESALDGGCAPINHAAISAFKPRPEASERKRRQAMAGPVQRLP